MKRLSMSPQCMVAWRANQKIWTRRIMNPQPNAITVKHDTGGEFYHTWRGRRCEPDEVLEACPYGQVGDVVAIAERHKLDAYPPYGYVCTYAGWGWALPEEAQVIPAADFAKPPGFKHPDRWRAAMFMPAPCCREWAVIRSVGVERLSAITDAAAIEEGVVVPSAGHWHTPEAPWLRDRGAVVAWLQDCVRVSEGLTLEQSMQAVARHQTRAGDPIWAARCPDGTYSSWYASPRAAFLAGWDAIQATRSGGPPDPDPWVWVLGLERADRDGRPRGVA